MQTAAHSLSSAIYTGWVRHRRFLPNPNAFRYKMSLLYLDLAELDRVFEGSRIFRNERPGLASFRRADHLGDPAVPLVDSVRDLVEARCGRRPQGPIRLLTHPRYFGYVMNPVSFYYCYSLAGQLETIVAEINNTPWGEQHCYVLAIQSETADTNYRFQFDKNFHVSPFMPMSQRYDWRFTLPGDALTVHMRNLEGETCCFDATMQLQRQVLSPATLRRSFVRYPAMTIKVVAGIYWQALRLRLKKTPFFEHPKYQQLDYQNADVEPPTQIVRST